MFNRQLIVNGGLFSPLIDGEAQQIGFRLAYSRKKQ